MIVPITREGMRCTTSFPYTTKKEGYRLRKQTSCRLVSLAHLQSALLQTAALIGNAFGRFQVTEAVGAQQLPGHKNSYF